MAAVKEKKVKAPKNTTEKSGISIGTSENNGHVFIADAVVTEIAALAASEIEGVELSALAKPSSKDPKKWGLSLRSYKYCDVAAIAMKYGGGGHARAAGFDYEGTTEEIKELLIGELKKY